MKFNFESGVGARIYPYLLVAPALILILGVVVYPVTAGLVTSFQEVTLRTIRAGDFDFVAWDNYRQVLSDPVFRQALRNTFIWVGVNVGMQLSLALAIALLLSRATPGIGFLRTGILLPWVIPSVVAVLTWKWMYDPSIGVFNEILLRLGWIEDYVPWLGNTSTALGAVLMESVWKGTPFVMLQLLAALQLVPQEYYNAASVDGANRLQRLRHITLPLIRIPLTVAGILTIILSVNNFNAVWLMTGGGPLHSSEILFTLAYKYGFEQFDLGAASALAALLFVALVTITTLYLLVLRQREDS